MRLNIKIVAVTIGFFITAIFFVDRNQNDGYDVRSEPLLIEFVSVSSFKPSLPSSGGWFGAGDVLQTDLDGQLQGWLWPLRGYVRAYSSRLDLDRILVRQMGIFRPDVESAKEGNREYRYSGFDFKFDVASYGQIECVVWTDGKSQDFLWRKNQSKCDQQSLSSESKKPEIFPFK
jgi:hypothetical protein